jgi:hypothetical protein
LATAVLVLRGGETVGPTLALLGHYVPGYRVTWLGSLLGLVYGALFGFAIGYVVASCRNLALRIVLGHALWRASRARRRHLLDEVG